MFDFSGWTDEQLLEQLRQGVDLVDGRTIVIRPECCRGAREAALVELERRYGLVEMVALELDALGRQWRDASHRRRAAAQGAGVIRAWWRDDVRLLRRAQLLLRGVA